MNRRPYNPDNERSFGPDREFEDWLADVDKILTERVGLPSGDLVDWNWRDAYDGGSEPEDAASDYIEDEFPGRDL